MYLWMKLFIKKKNRPNSWCTLVRVSSGYFLAQSPKATAWSNTWFFFVFFPPTSKHITSSSGDVRNASFLLEKQQKKVMQGRTHRHYTMHVSPSFPGLTSPPWYAYHTQAPFPFKRSSRCECSYWVKVCSFQVIMYNLSLISVVECLNYQVEIVTRKYEWMLINVHIDDKT